MIFFVLFLYFLNYVSTSYSAYFTLTKTSLSLSVLSFSSSTFFLFLSGCFFFLFFPFVGYNFSGAPRKIWPPWPRKEPSPQMKLPSWTMTRAMAEDTNPNEKTLPNTNNNYLIKSNNHREISC